jgi:hypothetical protein
MTQRPSEADTLRPTEENRFTVFVPTRESPDFRILERWADWFDARGIRARILWSPRGFALYREGLTEVPAETTTAFSYPGS